MKKKSTTIYNNDDNDLLVKNVDDIVKRAEDMALNNVEPTKEKMWEMIYVVRDFVIEKKRKIYGGFSLNKLLEIVDPKEKFYQDDDITKWDIDFYSPEPIKDAKEICDRLMAKGFKHIIGRDALHDETYKVFSETFDCADITYVPRNIYNKMPFKEVPIKNAGNLILTGAHFMMIDYFRVLTDPLLSYSFRLEKTFTRLCKMFKFYPLPYSSKKIEIAPPDSNLDLAFNTVHNFLIDRKSVIVVGMYPYNHYVKETGIKSFIDYVDINCYEVISNDYKEDARALILSLQDKFPMTKNKIIYEEHYPFFQYLGFSVNIYYGDELLCKMYHYNTRCSPFFEVPALYFKKGKYEEHKGTIRIGTFALNMLYNLINIQKARTDDNESDKNLYYTIISHINEMREYYFNKTKKNIMDETLFQEFVIKCSGLTIHPQMEKQIRIDKRKSQGKRYAWSYYPEQKIDDKYIYNFKNSSGNVIMKKHKRKISLDKIKSNTIDDEDDDEEETND